MQIDTNLVNLSIYLPIFSALVIGIIHEIIKSIKNVLKSSSLLTFIFDIIFSIIVIIINLFVFYLCNYGKLKLYSLLIELISYVVFRKIFGEILCKKLTKFNRVIKSNIKRIIELYRKRLKQNNNFNIFSKKT